VTDLAERFDIEAWEQVASHLVPQEQTLLTEAEIPEGRLYTAEVLGELTVAATTYPESDDALEAAHWAGTGLRRRSPLINGNEYKQDEFLRDKFEIIPQSEGPWIIRVLTDSYAINRRCDNQTIN
jgi:hypothetical protein